MKEIFFFFLIISKIYSSEDNKSVDIVILHINDIHSGVNDSIGYDGLMLLKKQFLKKYNNVIVIDAGDHIQGRTIGFITKGEALVNIMNKIGYNVTT